jgi:transposase
VKLLITVRGITPLTALAFLADVADIRRFKTLRKMNAYLGLVPTVNESGGKSKTGHITRQSRRLTRTLFTQSVMHFADASPYLRIYYSNLISRRGVGRARIALIRKICGMMRRMLLDQTEFRWVQSANFERKLKRYECQMKKIKNAKEERKIA